MTQDELIEKRTQDKYKRINEYRSETQLSIQLGQAVNLAQTEMLAGKIYPTNDDAMFDRLVDFYMKFLDKKRKEVFDENERAYRENPAPTVEQYEVMTPVQKGFLKDKQLAGNRKTYAERKTNPVEVCKICQGSASNLNPLVGRYHESCAKTEKYKVSNL